METLNPTHSLTPQPNQSHWQMGVNTSYPFCGNYIGCRFNGRLRNDLYCVSGTLNSTIPYCRFNAISSSHWLHSCARNYATQHRRICQTPINVSAHRLHCCVARLSWVIGRLMPLAWASGTGCQLPCMWYSRKQHICSTDAQGAPSFSTLIFHDFPQPKKWKSMTYRHNIYFQVNDIRLMNAYQN